MSSLRLILACCLSVPSIARAELRLDWDAPASCPRPASIAPEGEGQAEVLLREKANAWIVTVLFFEPTAGLRRVEAANCEEAVKAALLLLRLGGQSSPPLPAPAAPPAPEPVTQPQVIAPRPAFSAEAPWLLSLGAGASLDFGSLGVADSRLAVTAAASRGLLRAIADLRLGFPVPLAGGLRAERLIEGQLAACTEARLGSLAGGPCVALAAGSWRASSSSASATTWVLSTSAQLRGAVAIVAGFELGALAGLRFNLRRPAPFTEDGTVFTTPLLASELQLTVGWRW